MKNNDFAEKYLEYRRIADRIDEALMEGDGGALDEAEADMHVFNERIRAAGPDYARTFKEYSSSVYAGNDCIDLHEPLLERDVPGFLERLRRFDIDRFTFSCTFRGAVMTAWLFTENGCSLEGMVLIKAPWAPVDDGFAGRPAFLFSIP